MTTPVTTASTEHDPPAEAFTHAGFARLLDLALAGGFQFIRFPDAALHHASDRVCLLRHDCDNDLIAAERLSGIEAEHGVAATYFVMLRSALYNLLAPANRALLHAIISRGHQVGLHFDERPFADASSDEVVREIEFERAILAAECRMPIEVVSFHQPSARVLRGDIRLRCINTYDPRDMAGFHYASDSNMKSRSGSPFDLLRGGSHPRLHLLLHPEWWTPVPLDTTGKWLEMLRNNFTLMQTSLLEREDTYNTPHEITFRIVKRDP